MARTRSRRHTVAALVYHGVSPFELSVACEVFGLDRSELVDPWYRLIICSLADGPVEASAAEGLSLNTPFGVADLEQADTIVVPNWKPGMEPTAELTEALLAAHERGARIMSFCSGAFLLAAIGLLDGRPATTHWKYADALARRFPLVQVESDVLYVIDGRVMTSAGTAAAIDLCLHVVRSDHGAEVANAVARRMVVPPHRDGGQAQYVEAPVPPLCEVDDPMRLTIDWALEHLAEPLTVETLARQAATSPRTFARRFVSITGTTPLKWLVRQRVLLAQRLLETTDLPVERIASESGFGTPAGMRQHFQRQVGTSPLAYRRTFRASSSLASGELVGA
ncbi:MAG: helix-turn-helix domain-containing protein [Actinomycetota bacterium]|nr:helix-turn-helix domain-containing protein [Actinomycetota bacterium]